MNLSSVSPERWETIAPAGPATEANRCQGLRNRTNLIELDEYGIGRIGCYAATDEGQVGDQDVVADNLGFAIEARRHGGKSVPVTLGVAVLNGHDRVFGDPRVIEAGHLRRRLLALARFRQMIDPIGEKTARRRIERDRDIFAGREPSRRDGGNDQFVGVLITGKARAKPPSSPTLVAKPRCARTVFKA